MPTNEEYRSQVVEALKQRYFGMIPKVPANWTEDQHEKNRLSRSLAAFAIEKRTAVAPAQAAYAVIDGGDDNGLDAVHFDRANKKLWIVQSKAGRAPDFGENKKFCDGARDLIAAKFNKFNALFARLQPDVEAALETPNLKIIACNIHLGEHPLAQHAVQDLNDLKAELNNFGERFDWQEVGLIAAHALLTAEHAIAAPTVKLDLFSWQGVQNPRRAFFGQASAKQLAELYALHDKAILQKNIRYYLGSQSVNEAIAQTVRNAPSELFYLNNGMVAVCEAITPLPGHTPQKGSFELKAVSIVNGAQTLGAAAGVHAAAPISDDARILMTVIEIGQNADALGRQITSARNSQNAVRELYFVALDPNQERLRQELALGGISYHYRPSSYRPGVGTTHITVERAAQALACLKADTPLAVVAKSEPGELLNPNGQHYAQLFSGQTTGVRVCRSVRLFEYLSGILEAAEGAAALNHERMFYRHGRQFILHVFAKRNPAPLGGTALDLSPQEKTDLSRIVTDLAVKIYAEGELFRAQAAKGYLAIFQSRTDCTQLAVKVVQRLDADEAAAAAQRAAALGGNQTAPPTPPVAPGQGGTP